MTEEEAVWEILEHGDDALDSNKETRLTNMVQILSNELGRAVNYFREAREAFNLERGEWQKERLEWLRREREIAMEYEKCRREMQLLLEERERNTNREARPEEVYSEVAERLHVRIADVFGLLRIPSEGSDASEEVETPSDAEENEEQEATNSPEEPEEAAEANAEEAQEEPEEEAEVLEYSPVASTVEMPSAMEESRKRKAISSLAINEDAKRRKLTLVECPICLESLTDMDKSGKILVSTSCGHVMCSNCAMRMWILRKSRCAGCLKKTACCPKCHKKYDIQKLRPIYL